VRCRPQRSELARRWETRHGRRRGERGDERRQAPRQIWMQQVAGDNRVRGVRLRLECRTPGLDRIPADRPQPGQPRWSCTTAASG
jgi:hypothetical protein